MSNSNYRIAFTDYKTITVVAESAEQAKEIARQQTKSKIRFIKWVSYCK